MLIAILPNSSMIPEKSFTNVNITINNIYFYKELILAYAYLKREKE